ncbi:MAG TPA: DJ-1/PfpI family protein [Methanospirillum sp.]|uniref:DJ-1/PfpI family protein n=1 Tax=Methanospirillum sp. TaxID=45200 RepID=UPI002B527C4A|nr:DJ-1/PfpI family protein [Methanospirillum sp.]HOJ95726.1 DJ-1/PfpI family protein [Methanospirillum sp.]HOL40588.1 DJ-1/PfpI family protein [Methanospirillum sp.]HPP76829.1 DJ-1/PfpI family protein [Methanospirillum sp.]
MKKILILIIIILLSSQCMASEQTDPALEAVLVIPSAGWDEQSLNTAARELTTYDISWTLTGPSPGQVISDKEVQPLETVSDRILNTTAIIVIGGEDMSSLMNSEPVTRILQQAAGNRSLCAGIGNGTLVLAHAGVLTGVMVSLPDNKSREYLEKSGAIPNMSEGVITDTVITARGSDMAKTWIEVIIREIVAREITNQHGVLYLGDQDNGRSVYVIPERLTSPVVSGIRDANISDEWAGEPFSIPSFNTTLDIPVRGDWVLIISPENNVCLLYEQFTGLSIPYGSVVSIDSTLLGAKRDFSTNTVPIEEMIQDITFKDVYQNSNEYNESNRTLRNWTIEVNNTNSSVKNSVALLFDDIRIAEVSWEDLTLRACIEGNGVGKGILDILKTHGDESSSLAYDEEHVDGSGCYEVLISVDAPKGITAYLTLFGKDKSILIEKEIQIP